MFCPECGNKSETITKFCVKCGSAIVDEFAGMPGVDGRGITAPDVSKKHIEKMEKVANPVILAIKSNSKKIMVILSILTLIIVILGSIASYITTPEYVAENYFEALMDGNLNDVYSMTSLGNSEFITEESFVKSMESGGNILKDMEIVSYSVKEITSSEDDESDENVSSVITETACIEYYVKNEATPRTMDLQMVKQSDNRFLFFDNYKIVNNDILVSNYKIQALPFVKVSFDGIEVSERYMSELSDSTMVEYTLPMIVAGNHEIKVYGDKIKEAVFVSDVYTNSYVIDNVQFSDDEIKVLSKKSEEVFKELVNCAVQGMEFDEVNVKITSDPEDIEQIKNYYENIASNTVARNESGLKKVTFKSFNDEFNKGEIMSDGKILCNLSYEYDTESVEISSRGKTERSFMEDLSDNLKIYFTYEDGEYILSGISGKINY